MIEIVKDTAAALALTIGAWAFVTAMFVLEPLFTWGVQ